MTNIVKVKITPTYITKACKSIAKQIKQHNITQIVAIARGGYIPSRYLAKYLDIRHIHSVGIALYSGIDRTIKTVNIYQQLTSRFTDNDTVLIVDDLTDRGASMSFAIEEVKRNSESNTKILTCTIFHKPRSSIKPDFYYKEIPDNNWVVFPFE